MYVFVYMKTSLYANICLWNLGNKVVYIILVVVLLLPIISIIIVEVSEVGLIYNEYWNIACLSYVFNYCSVFDIKVCLNVWPVFELVKSGVDVCLCVCHAN